MNEEQFTQLLIAEDEFRKIFEKIKANQLAYNKFDEYDKIDRTDVEKLVFYINYLHDNLLPLMEQRINEMGMVIKMNKRRFKYLYDNYNSGNDESDEENKEYKNEEE